MNNRLTTGGAPVTEAHAKAVEKLIFDAIEWINSTGAYQDPAVVMDALINVAMRVAEHTGTSQRLAQHLVRVGGQLLYPGIAEIAAASAARHRGAKNA